MTKAMIKAIIFDLDNTLVDFVAMKRHAIDAAIGAMMDAGMNLTHEQIKSRIDKIYEELGWEYQQVFDKLLQDTLGYVDHRMLSAGIIAYRRAREAALKPFPHVTATIMHLVKMGIKLAVLSDAPAREAWLRLCYINFHHIFDVVVTFDDTGERKPSPKPFLLALDKLQVEPHEAIMIGDWAERDMVGAKNVGMLTGFARYGEAFGAGEVNADYDITDIKQLIAIVNQHNTQL